MTVTAVRIHGDDNVACLLRDHAAGERIQLEETPGPVLTSAVSMGHKIALADVATGAPVIKYGVPIGRATQDIRRGDHVHLHNLEGMPI